MQAAVSSAQRRALLRDDTVEWYSSPGPTAQKPFMSERSPDDAGSW
jgi:hypothetical protein